jgi:hypothetical protein
MEVEWDRASCMLQGLKLASSGLVQDVISAHQVQGLKFLAISAPHVLSSTPFAGIFLLRNPLQAANRLKITGDVSGKLVGLGTP